MPHQHRDHPPADQRTEMLPSRRWLPHWERAWALRLSWWAMALAFGFLSLAFVAQLGQLGALGRSLAVALYLFSHLLALVVAVMCTLGARARTNEVQSRDEACGEPTEQRLAALVRHGSDMLSILSVDGAVRYASPSHTAILGWPEEALLGDGLLRRVHDADRDNITTMLRELVGDRLAQPSLMMRVADSGRNWRWIEAVATNLLHEPSVNGMVLNCRDVTQRKTLEGQLLEQALMDPLTRLGNRRLFSDRVTHALTRRSRRQSDVAVLMLDLDHFKLVNDTLGHAKGDQLLATVADRLRNVTRAEDTVARLGGDEFAVLLEDLAHPDEALASAERIQSALSAPLTIDDRTLYVRASIGVAWAADGQSFDDLLTEADMAMYSAKSAGRGRVERYSAAMRAHVAERLEVEAQLHQALERDEFELVYQPVVDLVNGRISGAEALIRWRHPQQGILLPLRFITVAEESDLILDIGRLVLRRAARDAARFRSICAASSRLRVAVNLSARHVLSARVITDVSSALAEANLPGEAMAVELTESLLADNAVTIAEHLNALRALGLRVVLDDFGTGYSSLSYLRRLPIDVLKVDKSFVARSTGEHAEVGVVQAIVAIGHSLRLRTVAEGIETHEQLRQMRALGCSLGQGYLFSPPLEPEPMSALLGVWDASRFAFSDTVPLGFGLARVPGVTEEIEVRRAPA